MPDLITPQIARTKFAQNIPTDNPGGNMPWLSGNVVVIGAFTGYVPLVGNATVQGVIDFTNGEGIKADRIGFRGANQPYVEGSTTASGRSFNVRAQAGLQITSYGITDLDGGAFLRNNADLGFSIYTHDGLTLGSLTMGALAATLARFTGDVSFQSFSEAEALDTTFDGNTLTVRNSYFVLDNLTGSNQFHSLTGNYSYSDVGLISKSKDGLSNGPVLGGAGTFDTLTVGGSTLTALLSSKLDISGGILSGDLTGTNVNLSGMLVQPSQSGLAFTPAPGGGSQMIWHNNNTMKFQFSGTWSTSVQHAGFQLASDKSIEWSNLPNRPDTTKDLGLYRNAAGQLAIRGDSGLQVRNYANSADAPLTASTGNFSSTLTVGTTLNMTDGYGIRWGSGQALTNNWGPLFDTDNSHPVRIWNGSLVVSPNNVDVYSPTGNQIGSIAITNSFYAYNTITNTTNYERAVIKWGTITAGVPLFEISTQAAGTGTARDIVLQNNATGKVQIGNGSGDSNPTRRLNVYGDNTTTKQIRCGYNNSFYWEFGRDNASTGNFTLGSESGLALTVTNAGNATIAGSLEYAPKTIATLPSAAANSGKRYRVTNSAVTGGRTAYSNGTAWYYEDGTAV